LSHIGKRYREEENAWKASFNPEAEAEQKRVQRSAAPHPKNIGSCVMIASW
jgi:hypothetical protein